MRIALHTGKGGVGKTTMSAATAIAAASAGHRTLLLSTDPAHSVGDVLGVDIGADPEPVPAVPGLWAAQIDTRDRFEQAWSEIRGYLVDVLSARGMAQVQAEELTVLPGADEIVALLEVYRHATNAAGEVGGDFDVIVVDCGPSGESLKLLALPETIRFYGDRLMGTPARLMRTLAAGFAGLTGARNRDPAGLDQVSDALGRLLDNLTSARELLADNTITGIRIVLTPERVVIAEARRLLTALALHGFAVEAVVVNRMLPPALDPDPPAAQNAAANTTAADTTAADTAGADTAGFLAAWRASQRAAMPLIIESFGQLRIHHVALTGAEPVGVHRLSLIAEELFQGDDPVGHPIPVAGLRTEGTDGRYRLLIALPLADRDEVGLSRSGDDLVVTLGPHRRRIALPSVLQRCRTDGASFVDDCLVVEFVADPDLWPAALAANLATNLAKDDLAGAR